MVGRCRRCQCSLRLKTCLSCEDIAGQSCATERRWRFFATFLRPVFPASRVQHISCLLYTSPSPRDSWASRMPSSAWKKNILAAKITLCHFRRHVLSRGSMLKQNYFKEFWSCTEPRMKWNKIILAADNYFSSQNNFISFQTWFRATLKFFKIILF